MKYIGEFRMSKDIFTPQTFYIPKGAEVINVCDQDFDIALVVMYDYPAVQETDLRTFKICGSNEIVCEDNIKYVGSFGLWHIIEILNLK